MSEVIFWIFCRMSKPLRPRFRLSESAETALFEEIGRRQPMIDAALTLEGEKTGEIAEGAGAAIGGIGVEKFQIEEVATHYKIPLYAILVKQSLLEAITVMRKEIAEASDKVSTVLTRLIEEKTKEGDDVLVAGIGNTLGVAQ